MTLKQAKKILGITEDELKKDNSYMGLYNLANTSQSLKIRVASEILMEWMEHNC